MADQSIVYLPLGSELRTLLAGAAKTLQRITFYQKYGHPLELHHYLRLKFHDASMTQKAREQIMAFAAARNELGYGTWRQSEDAFRRAGYDPAKISADLAVKVHVSEIPDNLLDVHYDTFIPKEYRLFLEDVAKTRLHFFPLASSLTSSLDKFDLTYKALEVIRVFPFSFDSRTNAYSDEDIAALHDTLLALSRQIIPRLLSKRPVHITIDGSVKNLSVSVDGTVVKTSPTQTRGVIALTLLKYDHWFSLGEFCKIALSKPSADLQGDFDDALKFLKRHEPFGWDPDHGSRRIKGAIIESLVDEAVLRAYLNQK